jgi:hypothetical protein
MPLLLSSQSKAMFVFSLRTDVDTRQAMKISSIQMQLLHL